MTPTASSVPWAIGWTSTGTWRSSVASTKSSTTDLTSDTVATPGRTRPRSYLCTMAGSATLTATGKPTSAAAAAAASGPRATTPEGVTP